MRSLAVGLAIASLLALSVYRVMEGPRWLNRDAPLVETPVPVTPPPMDVSRHVLFIVLDGARVDAVPLVPALAPFSQRATLTAELPTISAAQYVALLSGVPPEDSGRRSNSDITPTGLDSVGAVVRRAGGKAAAFSDCVDWWWNLFPDAFDAHGDVTQAQGLERFNFTVVHLCAFDNAGHRSGAASDDYRVRAAALVERDVSTLLAGWRDLGPVVVTADHGHRDAGGHGSDEPEVRTTFALFRNVDGTPRANGRAVDLASTLSGLLHVPAPTEAQGTDLFGTAEPPQVKRRALESLLFPRLLRALVAALGLAVMVRFGNRRGFVIGLGALALTCVTYLLRYPVSISGHRDYGLLVIDTAVVALVCTLLVTMVSLLRMERRDALPALLAAAGGTGLLAVAADVVYGVASPRLTLDSAFLIALPSVANAAWAGSLLALLICVLLAALRASRTSSRVG